MLPLSLIREDLREIRYYYSKQKLFDDSAKTVEPNAVLEKVNRYNKAMKNAPARLYDLYVSLYVSNNTQAALSYEWDYCPDYVKQLNKQLCLFLSKELQND